MPRENSSLHEPARNAERHIAQIMRKLMLAVIIYDDEAGRSAG